MQVDFMRKVDLYLGMPICFFFSIISSIQKLFGFRRIKDDFRPKKILFIELSEMGSTILAYSAMIKAKELFNAELYFLIFKENEQSIKLLNIIPDKNVFTIRSKSLISFFLDTSSVIRKIRKEKIDTVIDLELFSRATSILSFLIGARARVGFYKYHMEGLYRGNFQTHKVEYNPHIHISQGFMALIYSLQEDINEVPLLKRNIEMSEIACAKISSNKQDRKNIISKLKKLNPDITESNKIVILNPNASQLLPIRKWPLNNFKKLAKKILEIPNAYVIITGVNSEKDDAQAICSYVNDKRCIDFTGKTTLKELIDLYNISKVIVSNDSGPPHFASLTDIKIIVLFGPETPKIYSPLGNNCIPITANFACSPCVSAFNHRKTPCNNNKCLQAIKIDTVYSLVKKNI